MINRTLHAWHRAVCTAVIVVSGALLLPVAAQADFGIAGFDGEVSNRDGSASSQAGAHPYANSTRIVFNSHADDPVYPGRTLPDADARDIVVDSPPGFVGAPAAVPAQCSLPALLAFKCPVASQVGLATIRSPNGSDLRFPLYKMIPLPGSPAQFAFNALDHPVLLTASVRNDSDYGLTIAARGAPQAIPFSETVVTFWGVPADPSHDIQRCPILGGEGNEPPICDGVTNDDRSQPHSTGFPPVSFLRNPTSCTPAGVGLRTNLAADSWPNPGVFAHASYFSHVAGDPLTQLGPAGCALVPFDPTIDAQPTSQSAETPTGLSVRVDVPVTGFNNPDGIGQADIKKAIVTLPEGVTINPSQAEGLGVCTSARYASEELSFQPTPSTGCPSDSKIGTVEVHTPLLEETLQGDVFIAAPHDNPFGSLLALYVVIKNPERGIIVKLAGRVATDSGTGRITTTFDDIPQQPISSFDFRFRAGARAPLVTPAACGTYSTITDFVPWSAADPNNPTPSEIRRTSSDFQVTSGIGGAPCPSGGLPPFRPGLIAGSLNNNAGSYSPFNVRLFRTDAEQEITHFSIKLPPGIAGKLAGIPFCPDAAIEAAKSKTRTAAQELEHPSCPAASEVGRTLVGAGVGTVLAYAPGKIYLAGPYHGSALSIAAITAAKVGPFDLGTVVVRQALKINPDTAEVFIDATGSDPIPHIIDGITTHLRDIRAYVDRPEFTLNPTSCDATSTASTVLGSGLDFASESDDRPVTVTTRYQAANCASLGFKPKLALSLRGGTRRGDNPALKAVLTARRGDANIGKAQVTLPHSEFLDQSHIKTICTRVQFAAGTVPGEKCPPASVYGYARAITPLLDEPLRGPVFLRSSSHNLPDLVAALHSGRIDINVTGRIDSVGKDGRIRSSFDAVPDAPVTKFTLTMQGGKKGLLVNSANLCERKNRAIAAFIGQNSKVHDFSPVVKPQCGKKAKKSEKRP